MEVKSGLTSRGSQFLPLCVCILIFFRSVIYNAIVQYMGRLCRKRANIEFEWWVWLLPSDIIELGRWVRAWKESRKAIAEEQDPKLRLACFSSLLSSLGTAVIDVKLRLGTSFEMFHVSRYVTFVFDVICTSMCAQDRRPLVTIGKSAGKKAFKILRFQGFLFWVGHHRQYLGSGKY